MSSRIQLSEVTTQRQRRAFVDFVYTVYRGNPFFKDSHISVLRTFLDRSDSFTCSSTIRPLAVQVNGHTAVQAVLFHNPGLPALQLAFFEALSNQGEAVERLLAEARTFAASLSVPKLLVGINGHVACGVGLLREPHDQPVTFDCAYCPPYYFDYFDRPGFREHTLESYWVDLSTFACDPERVEKINRTTSYRTLRPDRFEEDLRLFGDLCNRSLAGTPFYYSRDPQHLVDLLRPLRPFLKKENLIFAIRDGREIGFIFWHPDYNELFRAGRRNSMVRIGLAWLLRRNAIRNVKLNAIGVVPEHQRTGVSTGLLDQMSRYCCGGRYSHCETNYVFTENAPSRGINQAFHNMLFRRFSVFEADVAQQLAQTG